MSSAPMNCLAFRRQLAVDPGSRDPVFLAHRDECAGCAEAYARAQAFEQSLRRALAVPVPEGLAERVLLRQTTDQRVTARRSGPGWLALAAAAAVALSLAAGVVGYRYLARPDIGAMSVAHVPGEANALTLQQPLPMEEVLAAFAHDSITLAGAPQPVVYAVNCEVGDSHAVHMVAQADDGPVVVFFYGDRKESQRSDFEHDGMVGRAVPMGQGTLVLVAARPGSFDDLESAWRGSLVGGAVGAHNAAGGGD